MRGLIFGGEGMLGRAVAVEGRRRGHAVLAVGRGQGEESVPEADGRGVGVGRILCIRRRLASSVAHTAADTGRIAQRVAAIPTSPRPQ